MQGTSHAATSTEPRDGDVLHGRYSIQHIGWHPDPDAPWVSWPDQLRSLQQHMGLGRYSITSLEKVASLQQLQEAVAQDASLWINGTGPNDPPLTDLQQVLQQANAGELQSLLCGKRGVVMVQLYVGWDAADSATAVARQPLFRPLVGRLLQEALAHPGLKMIISTISDGLGLTAILYADKEPFASRAKHLASFGAQAGLIAGSAYYQYLVGAILGYKPENIVHHIQSRQSGVPGDTIAQVERMVTRDLAKLSKVKARLPWNAPQHDRRGKRKAQK
ncbi:hypothetical protein WJX72_010083 [[Myrmecia] bisecta]|uniref:Uncharacterized protein n=1 Tax=[Myrmecia] bisecta TaxID=41462 RepID=A0AAW1R8T1_9CHLO